LHGSDDLRDGAFEDVFLLKGFGTEGGEDYVGTFDGLANRCWLEDTTLDGVDVISMSKCFRRAEESRNLKTSGEAALCEEFTGGAASSEEGDLHCWLLWVRD
jgi:hypothetical protein